MKKTKEELKQSPIVTVKGRFTGKLKNLIIEDLATGIKGSDLLREMAKHYYDSKNNY